MRGDINLLPKKKSGEITKLATGFIVGMIAVIVICLIVFIYLPNMEKRSIKKEIEAKQVELERQTATKEEYDILLEELNVLRYRNQAFSNLKRVFLPFSNILTNIEAGIPSSIVIEEMSYTTGVLKINGTTPSAVELSRFMVNLRRSDDVIGVYLSSMEQEPNPGDASKYYNFELSLIYFEIPEDELTMPEEIADETEDEETVTDEIVAEDNITDEGAEE